MKHVVSVDWLFEHGTDDRMILVDCRFVLGQPDVGRIAYEKDHIPGAHYLDLEKDLSSAVTEHGGRHPLPDVDALSRTFGRIGIHSGSVVIAYDDQGGAYASRLWWLLTYLGHERVYILDGGYSKWKEAGYPVTDEPPLVHEAQFVPKVRGELVVDMEGVRSRQGRPGTVLIDSREARRYQGIEEPIDKTAGHIPGAVNYFWKDSLTAEGAWKSAEAQKERFGPLAEADEIIVYCGSGVTACPNVLALSEAGLKNVKLYAGSWSDWISYPDNPVAVGEE
ncbi:sulfurtransferase [Paenibacillus mucilaginosus]|uniref:Rhodanese domain-containing protein n=3 Tax=Paenibacillus mucilaginosus TaxID=61624 RepID=H6NBK9_9BACL|nr:sulfurtransferase [Paenibacillus mucilaginosus]AEI46158.1 Rhodanese domain protein [Paenibacillus mucilaginosus KNP414]AFC33778.1 Rhodanese domain-containing protein [Paenibacillus mucilaginosus 3016]AFH66109.1 3-mercaptopyruvate sulfurtransferase [Paenibacillus mucilaginosus K02]MCG7213708.1 sulfurtransferase [Paenibacillus mucilaginosus]WDM27488.1 sulfurtransferase [Paenibacillus mucilaginosus]